MSDQLYNVVFSGEVYQGKSSDEVAGNLAKLMGLQKPAVEALLSGGRVVIKSGVSLDVAKKYVSAFDRAGAIAVTEPVALPDDPPKNFQHKPAGAAKRPATNTKARNDEGWFTKKSVIAGALCLSVGYFVGREHIKYEIRSAVEIASDRIKEGMTKAVAPPEKTEPIKIAAPAQAASPENNRTVQANTRQSDGHEADYVKGILLKIDQLLAITKVGATKASSCEWNLSVHKSDKDRACSDLSKFFEDGSRYRTLLGELSSIDGNRIDREGTIQQRRQFQRDSREIQRHADEMLKAVNFYTEYLRSQ